MDMINGIILNGNVYEVVNGECKDCAFQAECKYRDIFNDLCNYFEEYKINKVRIFRYSPELTERLKNPKTKEK